MFVLSTSMGHRTLFDRNVAAKLNHPYITSFLRRSALGFRPNKRVRQTVASRFGLRLWRKLRKKLHRQLQPESFQLKRRSAWEILFNLTCFSRAPFEEAKRLRSDRYVPDEIYSLIRLSNSLEEPGKSKARKVLKSVCQYRNMSWPTTLQGLQLKFTAHPNFGRDISQWTRNQVLRFKVKDILVPFHLPSYKVREQPHQSLKDFLHNFKDWDKWLQHHSVDEAPCPCHHFTHILPEQCLTRGHVVAGIEQLGKWHRSFEKLGDGSASSAFFPAKHELFKHNIKMFASWRRKHCLPLVLELEFRAVLEHQWQQHIQYLSQEKRLTWKDVSLARDLLHKHFIVHCEDHESNHLMVYCPQFYLRAAMKTWQDPEVFEPGEGSSAQWTQQLFAQIPGALKRRYRWGINPSGTLPVGFVFLKRKKEFLKGRTIISYSNSCIKKLLIAAAQAILLMVRLIWPEAMGLATTPQLWRSLHEFLRRTPSEVHLAEVNDDLVGFFNSVPRQQILDSLSILVQMYSDRHYPSHISVCLKKQPNCESAWPGKPVAKGAKSIKFLHVSDLPAVVSTSFKAGVFTTLGLLFRQHRGTCIGNQISPVLSSLPVIQRESCWQREWNQFLSSAQFFSTKTF